MNKQERAALDAQIERDVRPWLPTDGGVCRSFAPEKVWLIRWGQQIVRLSRAAGRDTFWVTPDLEFTKTEMLKNGLAPDWLCEVPTAEKLLKTLYWVAEKPATVVVWDVPCMISDLLTSEQMFDLGVTLRIRKTLLHILTSVPELNAEQSMASIVERDHRDNGELWRTFVEPQLIL